jgi:hypothetical protein
MASIPIKLRQLVIERANCRCEYCGLSQAGQEATFHIDHIIPLAGGETTPDNLALARVSCSLHKSARQIVEDSVTGEKVNIFNPRQQVWKEHFCWDGVRVVGLTATGRGMIDALQMNRSIILSIRGEEELLGRHPPP